MAFENEFYSLILESIRRLKFIKHWMSFSSWLNAKFNRFPCSYFVRYPFMVFWNSFFSAWCVSCFGFLDVFWFHSKFFVLLYVVIFHLPEKLYKFGIYDFESRYKAELEKLVVIWMKSTLGRFFFKCASDSLIMGKKVYRE